jgi:sulfite reductase (ferredoxin)
VGTPMKETPTQRVERIKRERPSWSILDDIRRYARDGVAAIPDDDLDVRLRAWGLYTQGDGHGVRGERVPYFMLRVRTPNGILTAEQVHTIAALSARYARGSIDITNRQNFQLHWLRIEDVPAIWEALDRVHWTSLGACGDNTRTVTGCPLAGIDAEEVMNAAPYALRIDRSLNGNPEFGNLPRKFKITVTGCTHWCTYPEINDIGVTAAHRGAELGFHVRVGGGLSTRPHLAIKLNAFVRIEQLTDVVLAIATIFRDSDELRQNRARARLKYLFLTHGWTPESFLSAVEERVGYPLERLGEERVPESAYRDHVGIHAQQGPGLYYAGFSILAGRVTPEMLHRIADLAQRFGSGAMRTTAMQNVVMLDVPEHHLDTLRRAAGAAHLPLEGSPFHRGTLSCTGREYCKLAITETKQFSIRLAQELEDRLPGFSENIKINVTGCPNACGQHWIADVGLQGVLMGKGADQVEGYDVFVRSDNGLARRVGHRAYADDVPDALQGLLETYLQGRAPSESFRQWAARTSDAALVAALSTPTPAQA